MIEIHTHQPGDEPLERVKDYDFLKIPNTSVLDHPRLLSGGNETVEKSFSE